MSCNYRATPPRRRWHMAEGLTRYPGSYVTVATTGGVPSSTLSHSLTSCALPSVEK